MSLFHKTIGLFNLLIVGLLIYLWNPLALLTAIAGGSSLLILFMLLLFIIFYGTIKALRHIFSKKESQVRLTTIEQILMFAPLVNILLIISAFLPFFLSL